MRHLEAISTFLSRLGWLNPYLWTERSLGWETILQLNSRPLPDDLCGPGAYECSARWAIIVSVQFFITKWHLTEMTDPWREPNLNLEGFVAFLKVQKCDLSSVPIASKIICGSQTDHGILSSCIWAVSHCVHMVSLGSERGTGLKPLPGAIQRSTVIITTVIGRGCESLGTYTCACVRVCQHKELTRFFSANHQRQSQSHKQPGVMKPSKCGSWEPRPDSRPTTISANKYDSHFPYDLSKGATLPEIS